MIATDVKSMNVEQLRKAGYLVSVYHARQYLHNGEVMSRKEFEREHGNCFADWVDSYGGFTLIQVTTPDGEELEGKFNVPSGKQFNRKLGLKAALGRAFKRYNG